MSLATPDTRASRTRTAEAVQRTAAPLRVAVIGAGFIAGYHLEVLRRLGTVEVVAACDPQVERLQALCGQWDIPRAARSVAELLDSQKPDAVHVLVPPPYHYEVTEQCLQAGAHVLVEKPMALTGAECGRLIELARIKERVLGVNHNALYHPLFRRLLWDVAENKLGKVEHVVSVNNLPLAQLASGEHDHWMFRQPENVLFEQGPHPLSQICELLGTVREVTALRSGEQRLRGGNRFYSAWQTAMTCERGTAQLFLSFGRSFPEALLHVIGQDGSVQMDLLNNVYVIDRRTKHVPPLDVFRRLMKRARQVAGCGVKGFLNYGLSLLRLRGRSDPYYLSMKGSIEAFYASLRKEGRDASSAENGRHVIEGLEKITACATAVSAVENPLATADTAVAHHPFADASMNHRREGEVLVLGSTGFIGRRVVAALAEADYPVRVLVRRPSLLSEKTKSCRPSVFVGDIRNAEEVSRAVEGCRAVIHLVAGAPSSWADFEKLFVEGTRHVAEACLRGNVSQLLFASSISALYLGKRGVTITEDTPVDPYPEKRCDYSRAKVLCERLLLEMYQTRKLPVTIFRPGVVVGAGGSVEHLGVGYWPAGTHCISWGKGNAGLPFVLVDDVAAVFVNALDRKGLEGKAFNLVGDVRLSAAEYIDVLRAESGRDIRLHRQSVLRWRAQELLTWAIKAVARKPENTALSYRELAYRTLASEFDCARTKQLLDWQPVADRECFIELGIRRALAGGPVH